MNNRLSNIFNHQKVVIAMIHVDALPGTPKNTLAPQKIIDKALQEAEIYTSCGVDAIMIENMHDIPYLNKTAGHEISTLMAIITWKIKQLFQLPTGIQILAGANKQALAAAHSAGADFIRTEGYVFGHLADEGYMDANAGELLRYRKQIGAEKILIFTDIKKKHSSHALTSDISLAETAKAADFFLSDGIILSGTATGLPVQLNELKQLENASKRPLIIGSGITVQNIEKYFTFADAFIVGSHFKKHGKWNQPVDKQKVKNFMKEIVTIRKNESI